MTPTLSQLTTAIPPRDAYSLLISSLQAMNPRETAHHLTSIRSQSCPLTIMRYSAPAVLEPIMSHPPCFHSLPRIRSLFLCGNFNHSLSLSFEAKNHHLLPHSAPRPKPDHPSTHSPTHSPTLPLSPNHVRSKSFPEPPSHPLLPPYSYIYLTQLILT